MSLLWDVISWFCLIVGCGFALIGAIGILRLPNVFARMHGAGIIDTLGAGLILVGLAFQTGGDLVTTKLILIVAFLLYTSPATTHALARAALHGKVKPLGNEKSEKGSESSKT
jgi:multicomponent Na+:H+ antiporter subunit G